MIERTFWLQQVSEGLERKNIVWLRGVRRVGKTTLCKQFPQATYFDCELPSVRAQLEDPEYFLSRRRHTMLTLDEVHRLGDPSALLKIAADHFPDIRILATGSSTLSARRKFRDTLTDRKVDVWLQPLLLSELPHGDSLNIDRRLLRADSPAFLMTPSATNFFQGGWTPSGPGHPGTICRPALDFMKLAELLLRKAANCCKCRR